MGKRMGISPSTAAIGHVDGFALHIGERATLLCSAGAHSYGVVMNITLNEAKELYAESSFEDYVAEPVIVELSDGSKVEAVCYCRQGHWHQQRLCRIA